MTNTKTTKRALLTSVMALLLCFTMLLGTTFAWFTDTVTSEGNVIKTGNLKVGFLWADGAEDVTATTNWKDATQVKIFDYTNWEPGYAVARHLKVSNNIGGTLALKYQMRIVANFTLTSLAEVIDVYSCDANGRTHLGNLKNVIGEQIFTGSLEVGEESVHTIVLEMNKEAGNEYQGIDLGGQFSVELIATQVAADVDFAVPAARVTSLGESYAINYREGLNGGSTTGTLDTAYKFEPSMTLEEAEASEYELWHADFVVYADGDIPADSIMLAGYYAAWCELINNEWVGLINEDEAISAGTKVRLVEYLGTTVNWADICEFGNDGKGFQCGLVDLTNGGLDGITVTVELRLYAVGEQGACGIDGCKHPYTGCEISPDDYILIGTFSHTFQ